MLEEKSILIISYEYPPIKNVGGLRSFFFAKYLQEFNWKVSVLTGERHNQQSSTRLAGEKVYACKNVLSLNRFASRFKLLVPDLEFFWLLTAFKKSVDIIKNRGVNVVFASCNPFSSALLGVLIKKRFNIPLVVDFRDFWAFRARYPTGLHRFLDSFLESFVLKNVDYLIVVTKFMKEFYSEKYPFLRGRISVITNGFDIENISSTTFPLFNKFTIIYCGSFSGRRQPDLFLQGLNEFIKNNQVPPQNLEVIFIGPESKHLNNLIEELNLTQYANYKGYFPYNETLGLMFKSHVLLLVEPRAALTTKIFEYLATGKPILALIAKGELENLIKKYSNTSYIITSENYNEVAEAIHGCYDKWLQGKYQLTDQEKVETFKKLYSRRTLTEQLASILERLYKKYKI